MRKDPTEFRKRFAAWKNGKLPYKGGRPSAISEVDKSDADFAERLRSNWRQETWDWEGSGKAVTHKIGSADNIVYPNVQTTKGGGLIDFTNPIWKGVVDPSNRAIINKDYVPMKTELDAIWFGPNYKEYYPKFKDGKLPKFKDGTRYILNYAGDWDRITDGDVAKWMADMVITPLGVRPRFDYENNPNYVAPRQKNEAFVPDNTLWTRQQIEKAKNTRTWLSTAADVSHAVGEGAMIASSFAAPEIEPLVYPAYQLTRQAIQKAGRLYADDAAVAVRGLYRRGRNLLFPKFHLLASYYKDAFHEAYMEPWEFAVGKAGNIKKALSIADNNIDNNLPVRRFLISAPYEVSGVKPSIQYQLFPILLTMPNGNVISGNTTTGQINKLLHITPVYGKRGPIVKNISVLTDSERLPSKFLLAGDKSFTFPLKNDEEFNDAIAQYVQSLHDLTGYPVVGSTRLISKGYFGGQPGDTEIIAPAGLNQTVYDMFGFTPIRATKNNTGYTGTSNKVFSSSELNNLDINVVDDNGVIIHQLESTRMPDKMPSLYSLNAQTLARIPNRSSIKTSASLKIPKDFGDDFYDGPEYFNMVKNDDELLTLSIIDNTFKSDLKKHVGRAYVMMNSGDSKTIQLVSTAIDHMVSQIPGMKRFSAMFKLDFTDPKVNKEILNKINFIPVDELEFINNPEQMKNIVDYWYMRNTVGARSVNFYPDKGTNYDDVMQAVRSFDNGSGSGGGGNFILGNLFGAFTRTDTVYKYFHPKVSSDATFDDVFDAFQKERDIWSDKNAVNRAINEVLNDPKFNKPSIKSRLQSEDDSHFTDMVTALVNKGEMSDAEGNLFIEQVANKLGVSGFRGDQYGNYGKYYGAMIGKGRTGVPDRPVAFRNIDGDSHNVPLLPAEWGSDDMFYSSSDPYLEGIRYTINDESTVTPVITQPGKNISTKYATKKYPDNVIDLNPYYRKIKLLRRQEHLDDNLSTPVWMMDDASGVKSALYASKERQNHYESQLDKLNQLYRKRTDMLRRRDSAIKLAGTGSVMMLPLGIAFSYASHRQKFYESPEYLEYINSPEFLNIDINSDTASEDLDKLERKYYVKYRRRIRNKQNK